MGCMCGCGEAPPDTDDEAMHHMMERKVSANARAQSKGSRFSAAERTSKEVAAKVKKRKGTDGSSTSEEAYPEPEGKTSRKTGDPKSVKSEKGEQLHLDPLSGQIVESAAFPSEYDRFDKQAAFASKQATATTKLMTWKLHSRHICAYGKGDPSGSPQCSTIQARECHDRYLGWSQAA
ncbi:unnamed protein product [Amoebophrya sp. A120]|nr:unnamed protein product [Amoebophrya sp. A120]|eukprot:GSA120T00001831001.1